MKYDSIKERDREIEEKPKQALSFEEAMALAKDFAARADKQPSKLERAQLHINAAAIYRKLSQDPKCKNPDTIREREKKQRVLAGDAFFEEGSRLKHSEEPGLSYGKLYNQKSLDAQKLFRKAGYQYAAAGDAENAQSAFLLAAETGVAGAQYLMAINDKNMKQNLQFALSLYIEAFEDAKRANSAKKAQEVLIQVNEEIKKLNETVQLGINVRRFGEKLIEELLEDFKDIKRKKG